MDTREPHVRRGLVQHYKGGYYVVLGVGASSEVRSEHHVIYWSLLYRRVRLRPWRMFHEWIDGYGQPAMPGDTNARQRFRPVGPIEALGALWSWLHGRWSRWLQA